MIANAVRREAREHEASLRTSSSTTVATSAAERLLEAAQRNSVTRVLGARRPNRADYQSELADPEAEFFGSLTLIRDVGGGDVLSMRHRGKLR